MKENKGKERSIKSKDTERNIKTKEYKVKERNIKTKDTERN